MKKRVLSFLMVLCMMFSLVSVTAYAVAVRKQSERNTLDFTKYDAAIAALNELDNRGGAEVPIIAGGGTGDFIVTGGTLQYFADTYRYTAEYQRHYSNRQD